MTTNYDVANAHPSPSHASLSEALVDTLHEDTGHLRQRHELATMEIQGADESILIRPGSGTARGAADAFHRVYHKRVDKWSDHLRAELLHEALILWSTSCGPRSFQVACFYSACSHAYADDVRVTSITTEPVHTWSRVMANIAVLDTALDEMAQNTAKQDTLCLLCKSPAIRIFGLPLSWVVLGLERPVAKGTLVLTSTLCGSIRPELERRRTDGRFGPDFLGQLVPSATEPIARSAPSMVPERL